MKDFFKEVGITLGIALVVFLGFHAVIQSYSIYEQCMEPNFYQGDRILVNKQAYLFGDPQRGDVVILNPPINEELVFIKRIVAIPGDKVEVKGGALYINGTKIDEPYLMEPMTYTMPERTVPQGEYFVLGDNRNIANDSHNGWTVKRDNLIGKALVAYWPAGHWGSILHYALKDQLAPAG